MTIGGALSELNNLLKADDIPFYYKPSIKAVIDTIALSNLENPNKWIPVSERLPDLWDERYLVSLAWGGVGVMEYKSTGFHNYGSFSPVPIETVIAWMPLPEPYKAESEAVE